MTSGFSKASMYLTGEIDQAEIKIKIVILFVTPAEIRCVGLIGKNITVDTGEKKTNVAKTSL